MPGKNRCKTNYPGVFYIEGKRGKKFYIRYKNKTGKLIEEKTAVPTADKANQVRIRRMAGERSNNEMRESAREEGWTVDKIWKKYPSIKDNYRSRYIEENLYKNHVGPHFGKKKLNEIVPLDIDIL